MKKFMFAMAVVAVAGAGSLLVKNVIAEDAPEKVAQQSAESWLALVDAGQYAESWGQAAELLKGQMASEQFAGSLKTFLGPLGKVVSRKLLSAQYTKTLPGAPDGEYVVIQYQTSFEQKQSAVETITPMLEKDGQWRVSGYYIK